MTIKDTIWLLAHSEDPHDKREWAVLYFRAQGKNPEQVADQLHMSVEWVALYMGKIIKRFGIPIKLDKYKKLKQLQQTVFPAVKEFIEEHPETLKELPPPPADEVVIGEPVDETVVGEPVDEEEERQEREEERKHEERRKREEEPIRLKPRQQLPGPTIPTAGFVGAVLIGLCIIGLVGVIVVYRVYQGALAPAPMAQPQSTSTSQSPVVSAGPSETPIPSTPGVTPFPTLIPPPDGILFQDNFDGANEPKSDWRMVQGQWIVDKGRLTISTSDFYTETLDEIALNEPNWRNYILSMNVTEGGGSDRVLVIVRNNYTEEYKHVGFEIGPYQQAFMVYPGTNINTITNIASLNTAYQFPDNSPAQVELRVENDHYTFQINGQVLQDLILKAAPLGGIAIRCHCWSKGYEQYCPSFDDVKVTYLP